MKKFAPLFIILAVIIVALFVVFACRNLMKNVPQSPNPTVVPSSVPGEETPEPKNTNTPEPSKKPEDETPTPPNTSVPTATPAPTSVPTPTAAPTAAPVSSKGSFSSNTGTSLNMRIDWSYSGKANGKYEVTVKVYLECYTLSVSSRTDSTLKINGQTITFNTEEIRYSDRIKHEPLLTEYKFEASKNEKISIEANWFFRGKYSGVAIDALTAGGTFTVK